jgi:superfamily II DNA or RNA helicase
MLTETPAMNADERDDILRALGRIPATAWSDLLDADAAPWLRQHRDAMHDALKEMGIRGSDSARSLAEDVVDVLGHQLLSHRDFGPWVREQLLRALAPTKWEKLADRYRALAGGKADELHPNATQHGKGAATMAAYWHRGSHWAHAFCQALELPESLASHRDHGRLQDESVEPAVVLNELHDFQNDVYKHLRKLFADGAGGAAMLSLPTGAGKTRVAVEAVCDHLAAQSRERRPRDLAIWFAQSEELLEQAWTCFRQVWQGRSEVRRTTSLSLVRAWGGRSADSIEVDEGPTVILAGVRQVCEWLKAGVALDELLPLSRHAMTVVDEAHGAVAPSVGDVLLALRQRAKHQWQTLSHAPPVVGLSATPWRTHDAEDERLQRYFQHQLVTPKSLGAHPIAALQERKILSRVKAESLTLGAAPEFTAKERELFEEFKDLPPTYLQRLGREPARNARIVERLLRLGEDSRALVFACSVEHAELLTLLLNRASGEEVAAVVTGKTPRAQRASVIARFRAGEGIRFLCNVSVLTTGFDAPQANVVCLTRPTTSAVLYEQMVGRGLRGPKNGGTPSCLVLDAQDEGLPGKILSYARVRARWDEA